MDDFIEALQIFRKYTDSKYISWCEYDAIHICVNPSEVSEEDIKRLEELSFYADYNEENFYSFRFGSC